MPWNKFPKRTLKQKSNSKYGRGDETKSYWRCSTPSGAEPAPSSSRPAAATRRQTAGRGRPDGGSGTARRAGNSGACEQTRNSPARTRRPWWKQENSVEQIQSRHRADGLLGKLCRNDSQVSAVESQIFLHQTLRFNHGGLLLTGATAASRTPVQFCRGRPAQLRPPALHVQPSPQHSGTWSWRTLRITRRDVKFHPGYKQTSLSQAVRCLLWAASVFVRDLHAASCACRLADGRAALPPGGKPPEALVARTHQLRPHDPELHTANDQSHCFHSAIIFSDFPPRWDFVIKLRRSVGGGGRNCEQRTEDVGNAWPTAGTHPAGPGGCLPRCLSLRTALCRSPQTFAALAGTPLCRTPARRENSGRAAVSSSYSSASPLSVTHVFYFISEKNPPCIVRWCSLHRPFGSMGVFVDKLDSLHAITKNTVKLKRKVCLPSFDFFFWSFLFCSVMTTESPNSYVGAQAESNTWNRCRLCITKKTNKTFLLGGLFCER